MCQGSNLGPFEYQSNALPTELHTRDFARKIEPQPQPENHWVGRTRDHFNKNNLGWRGCFYLSFSILFRSPIRFIELSVRRSFSEGGYSLPLLGLWLIVLPHSFKHCGNRHCQSRLSAGRFQIELLHDQLPLAVPCYDLVLVIEFTVGPLKAELRALPTSLT